jgi:signal peptidase II
MATAVKAWAAFLVFAIVSAAADLVSKEWLFRWLGMPGDKPGFLIVPGVLSLETNLNEGALFGLGQGMGVLFATISVVAIIGILVIIARPATHADPRLLGALGLITGGIVGNLYDRLGLAGLVWREPATRAGTPVIAVRDWIHFRIDGVIDWPVFNLADTWLVVGAAVLLVISFRPTPGEPCRGTDGGAADAPPLPPVAGQTRPTGAQSSGRPS